MGRILGDYLWSLLACVAVVAVTAAFAIIIVAFFRPDVVVTLLSG
jgi:hypothetical protein